MLTVLRQIPKKSKVHQRIGCAVDLCGQERLVLTKPAPELVEAVD